MTWLFIAARVHRNNIADSTRQPAEMRNLPEHLQLAAATVTDATSADKNAAVAPADAVETAGIDAFLSSFSVEPPPPLSPRVVAAAKRLSGSSRPLSADPGTSGIWTRTTSNASAASAPSTSRGGSFAFSAGPVDQPVEQSQVVPIAFFPTPPKSVPPSPPLPKLHAAEQVPPLPPQANPILSLITQNSELEVRVALNSPTGPSIVITLGNESTVQLIADQAKRQWNLAGPADAWQLSVLSPDGNSLPIEGEAISSRFANEQLILRRVRPSKFPIKVKVKDGTETSVQVDITTTVREVVKSLVKSLDGNMSPDGFTLQRLSLTGDVTRPLQQQETPFCPTDTATQYVLQPVDIDATEVDAPNCCVLLPIHVFGACTRNIWVEGESTMMHVTQQLLAGLNIRTPDTVLVHCRTIDGQELEMDESTLLNELLNEGNQFYLTRNDSVDISWEFLESCKDMNIAGVGGSSGNTSKTTVRSFSLRKSFSDMSLTSSAVNTEWSTSDNTSSVSSKRLALEEKIARNADKVAAMLGVTSEHELHKLKSQISKLYGKDQAILKSISEQLFAQFPQAVRSTEDAEAGEVNSRDTETKRMSKLTALLGIENERELANFLDATSASSESEAQRGGRSAQKVAKLLGVNKQNPHPSFRSRKNAATQYSSGGGLHLIRPATPPVARGPRMTRGTPSSLGNQEAASGGATDASAPATVAESRSKRPKVTNGQFTVKIYLMNQTFKTISVPLKTTAKEIINILVERLNIHDDGMRYAIFEDRCGTERLLLNDERLFDAMCLWEDKELFLFRKTIKVQLLPSSTGHRASADSLFSIKSSRSGENASRIRNTRRAAKIANIFGVNETKSAIADAGAPEINNIVSMLNNRQTKPQAIQEECIVKEGWLIKEEGSSNKGNKGKPHWCWIENGTLRGTLKSDNKRDFVVDLEGSTAMKTPQRKSTFEVAVKAEPDAPLCFTADSATSAEAWLDAIRRNAKLSVATVKPTASADEPAPMTMEDFEIHRVLGRGKFGKVLLCRRKETGAVYAIKVIKKSTITDERQVANTQSENRILRAIRHPFIVSLFYAFQTPERLHLVMEYVNGGEMFFHVNHFGRFSEARVRFYGAEILLAMQCIHGKGIVYRDLKLENILLDKDGHVKVTDFGLSKQIEDETQDDDSVIAGTLEYLAPEVIAGSMHSYPADWWAYGNVLFEMLCGFHPFYCEERDEMFQRIMFQEVEYPNFVSSDAKNLLQKLFSRDVEQRIGTRGGQEIQSHPFFATINFEELFDKTIEPPFKPDVTDDFDVSFFDEDFTQLPAELTPASTISFLNLNKAAFDDFSYSQDSPLRPRG